ncbi:ubiquitin-conjugating enzyme E2 l [Capsaspora owczarzaki ATCC 30864]|uniref:E2 ubiquitin-conjugating enzyme n=1 Tax=Capsaspora owczarzaki (strain ATCC 30864) TaxID=595528 RepID=A0A0D2WKM1_CAPO3|nr:ubiquitin-conjugating enzyme E2 l [Capsaspora owczarzaki ATCC 30864]KJE90860.1 ubiquitin-conjugating enzyme E2 l [Capsaspora owczarzaki ATCC 30864]|eukprot:XP_004348850.1 ubiquitin-conjugating enzyme E2 l [Capsaspora owczarzaki ATCC 30864]
MASRRLVKEFEELQGNELIKSTVRNVTIDETNVLAWEALLVPDVAPYNKGAFKISITFPSEYPFKPPKVTFLTKIYHPNVDESGVICIGLLKSEAWKPATRIDQVLSALVDLVNEPNAADPLNTEVAEVLTTDKKKFVKNVEEHIKKHAEKRPKE